MKALERQLHASLLACCARGAEAIRLFEAGDASGGLRVLRWRKAAFHNFRVAKERLPELSEGLAKLVSQSVPEVEAQDIRLMALVSEELGKAGSLLAALSKHRDKIGRFRAAKGSPGNFSRVV